MHKLWFYHVWLTLVTSGYVLSLPLVEKCHLVSWRSFHFVSRLLSIDYFLSKFSILILKDIDKVSSNIPWSFSNTAERIFCVSVFVSLILRHVLMMLLTSCKIHRHGKVDILLNVEIDVLVKFKSCSLKKENECLEKEKVASLIRDF